LKINYKLIVFIIAAAISLTVIGNWIFGISFKNYLLEQENCQIETNVQNICANLHATMVKYEAIAGDWGYWDETHDFIDQTNPDYVEMNLGQDSIETINTSFMLFLNKKHEVIYKYFFDFETSIFLPFPPPLMTAMEELAKINRETTRIIKSGEEYYTVSMTNTTDSLRSHPANGFLLVGRLIDTDMMKELEKISNSNIVFQSKDTADRIVSDQLYTSAKIENTAYSTRINEQKQELTTYIFPSNPDQSDPSVAIKMIKAREIYMGGIPRLRFIQTVYSLFIILIVLILFGLLWINITNPLYRLSAALNNIDIKKTRFDKLPTDRKNEFSIINHAINTMFSRIEEQQEKLKNNENRLIEAQLMAHVGNWEMDIDSKLFWGSAEAYNIYGLDHPSKEISLEIIEGIVLPDYRESRRNALAELIANDAKYDVVFKIKNIKNEEERYVRSKAIRVLDENGKPVKIVGTVQDVTEYKNSEEEILYLSNHDQLTGLYNRRFYEKALEDLDTEANLPITVAMGDINGLKLINDSFGHPMGDELIRKAADAITQECRTGDIVARLGGDEISIIFPKTDAAEADKIISRIIESASNEKVGSINVSISFGHETKKSIKQNIKEVLKNTEDLMYRNKLYESTSARSRTIDIIMNALYEKSDREMIHSMRVSAFCEAIAKNMNFSNDAINQIRTAGLMHDIGKIGIDEKILNKPGKLNKEEWREIEKHSEIGYRILSSANEFSEMANFVLEHHEKWDGTGYPRNIKGEGISLQARIITLADSYDAMTSERTYGKAFNEEEAVNEIRRCTGTHFDPAISRIFLEKVLGQEPE